LQGIQTTFLPGGKKSKKGVRSGDGNLVPWGKAWVVVQHKKKNERWAMEQRVECNCPHKTIVAP